MGISELSKKEHKGHRGGLARSLKSFFSKSPRKKKDQDNGKAEKHGVRKKKGSHTSDRASKRESKVKSSKKKYKKHRFSNGDVYVGEFEGDRMHGRGMLLWASGDIYEGEFFNNMITGNGEYRYNDGSVYVGAFQENKKHGKGIFRGANGDLYEGEYANDAKEGQGEYRLAVGHVYIGQFQNGKKHGTGVFKWANGDTYEGEFANDTQHGKGKFVSKKFKYTYIGQFENGKRTSGQMIQANGESLVEMPLEDKSTNPVHNTVDSMCVELAELRAASLMGVNEESGSEMKPTEKTKEYEQINTSDESATEIQCQAPDETSEVKSVEGSSSSLIETSSTEVDVVSSTSADTHDEIGKTPDESTQEINDAIVNKKIGSVVCLSAESSCEADSLEKDALAQNSTPPTTSSAEMDIADTTTVKETARLQKTFARRDPSFALASQKNSPLFVSAKHLKAGLTKESETAAVMASLSTPPANRTVVLIAPGMVIYPYTELSKPADRRPPNVNHECLEMHLSDIEFEKVFRMSRDAFARLPAWKQVVLKKDHRLY
eukprot:TRINITY_DN7033_c0_g1_i3.p1 TRINITY_DN7033_c0_g1~~TRINITY_DN7033_c0_g1_i3.p1  ORF type:complete len:546 (+),score=95.37 TRINITY_DN7033_c0_g1_i3:702-2339(+)